MIIAFAGPFSWPGTPDAPSVFDVDEGHKPGIYVWTVSLPEGHLVYYVGETGRSFYERLFEHYREHAAAMYHVWSPAEFARGNKIQLWPGCQDVKEWIANYSRLSESISKMTYILRFFLAPLSCDTRIRRRIEAAIAQALYATPGIVGTFQDQGIRYCSRTNDEEPIGCIASSPVPLLGLEEHGLGGRMLEAVNLHLQSQGVRITTGTIVDATIIHAPSST
ncbi:MAG: hypothetical protein ACLP3R_02920, partial [Candidatus Korobacteraceae bacterium]